MDEATSARMLSLIEGRFGMVVPSDMRPKLRDIVHALLGDTSYADADALCSALLDDREAGILEAVAAQLTVPETHFFRVAPQIAALRTHVLPAIIREAELTHHLRLWSAGCSTGEEPYTLAMLLRERLGDAQAWRLELIASDLNRHALDIARSAAYGSWSFRDTPDDIRARYFTREGEKWRLADSIRRMVRFFPLNLAHSPLHAKEIAEGRFDLILCRNVTIYFSEEARRRLYDELIRLLTPHGWLILGPSDPAPEASDVLQPRILPGAVLWQRGGRRPVSAAPAASPPVVRQPHHERPLVSSPSKARSEPSEGRAGQRIEAKPAAPGGRPPASPRRSPASGRSATASPSVASLDPSVHLATGLRLLDSGDAEAAVESLRSSVYLDPENPLAHFTLGRAYLQLGQRGRAGAETREALRLLDDKNDDDEIEAAGVSVGELRLATVAQFAMLNDPTTG